ncbi:MAG: sigma-54-dependent Fis family transcriptional regulator [Bacteriovoracaceae bacterium]|jgi:Nif-specific regulatory protein|nr:sigma-54-dependent Fis family transcriptional regulator [Bacteriovoracaceae bacterium]
MTEVALVANNDEIKNLSNSLFSSLEEKHFFPALGAYFHKMVGADNTKIFIVNQDQSASLISENGKISKKKVILVKGEGSTGHVIRTRKPYFSNNTERDPLFSIEASAGVRKELIAPIVYEGIVIATIHFQVIKKEIEFSRDHITNIFATLNNIQKPIANMKMYLAAKFLNSALLEQIETKEKELNESKNGLSASDSYKIEDKKIVGKSDSMKHLLNLVEKIAKAKTNTLIEGLTGTGKEMVARKIHCLSDRSNLGFVSIDCSALTELQLEVEIFGEEVVDFTKGPIVKTGILEKADGGTLFINNIDQMPLGIQTRLSQYISEGLAFRVNGQAPYRTNVRILGATSKDLTSLVEGNMFREDLFFALAAITIKVPSLKERKEDIELLANYFLNKDRPCDEHKSLSPSALQKLLDYAWPGNVRELNNVMERAFILSDGMIVEKDHLSENILRCEEVLPEEAKIVDYTEMTLDELEKIHITSTLDHLGGNKTRTAKTLGITVKTLYNKLHSYGMIAPKEA